MESSTAKRHTESPWAIFGRLRDGVRFFEGREALRSLLRCYKSNDLLTYASAISFQVLFALIPLVLFALGLLGFLQLQDVWRADLVPDIKPHVSPDAFHLIDRTVTAVLGGHHLFWVSFGALIAVWEISGAMRAVMQVFNRIYEAGDDPRPFVRRMLISFALAAASGVLALAAFAVGRFGPLLVTVVFGNALGPAIVFFILRWLIVVVLLFLLVGVLVRFAPSCRRPLEWVSFGALIVVAAWLAMSLLFGWYLSNLADYGSLFGSLATIVVTMEYLYLSAIVFLTGVQVDALVRSALDPRLDSNEH